MSSTQLDLSAKLTLAAHALTDFAATGDYQFRNNYNSYVRDAFKAAARNDVALDAILHMSEQLAKRDPVTALDNLQEISKYISRARCEAFVLPVIDRIWKPEIVPTLFKNNNDFPKMYLIGTVAARYILEKKLGFAPDNLTAANTDSFLRIAYRLVEREDSANSPHFNTAVRVLMAVIKDEHKAFGAEYRKRALLIAARPNVENAIKAIDEQYLEATFKPALASVLLDKEDSRDEMKRNFTGYLHYLQDGSQMTAYALELLPQVHANIRNHPETDRHWTNDDVAASMAKDVSNFSRSPKSVKTLAWGLYEAYAKPNMPKQQHAHGCYEHAIVEYAIGCAKFETSQAKGRRISHTVRAEEIQNIRKAVGKAVRLTARRPAEMKRQILLQILRNLSDAGAIDAAGPAFAAWFSPIFRRGGVVSTFEHFCGNGSHSHHQYTDISSVRSEHVFTGLYREFKRRFKRADEMFKLRVMAHYGERLDAADHADFIATLGRVAAATPDAVWPVVETMLEHGYHNYEFGKTGRPADALLAYMPYIANASEDTRQRAALTMHKLGAAEYFGNSGKNPVRRFIKAQRTPIGRAHPAFKVAIP
ncbi:MAG: hypothetical protein KGQ41_05045 [Alphaproteobacteria bacterium]|nr:hypothetical protein [Alphaproteobacteria bacterium]